MLSVNNISFYGNFRYLGAIPGSIEELNLFEVGKERVSKQLLEFSEKSAFLNKLKEDRDVMLCHYRNLSKTEFAHTDRDYLTVIFANNKPENPKDTELCAIRMDLPINKNTPDNLDRFERILEANKDINILRAAANYLFPKSSHKVAHLPNSAHGFCEFWTGKRTADSTLDKLFMISRAQIKNIYEQINQNIIKKTFG